MKATATFGGFSVIPLALGSSSTHYIYARPHQSSQKSKQPSKSLPTDDGRTLFLANVPVDCTERELAQFFKANGCGSVEKVVFSQDGHVALSHGPGDEDEVDEEEDEEMANAEEGGEESDPSSDEDEESHKRNKRKKARRPELPAKPKAPKVAPLPALPARTLRQTGHTAHVVFLDTSSLTTALSLASLPPNSKRLKWPPSSADPEPSGLQYYLALHDSLHPSLPTTRVHADTYLERYEFDKAQSKKESKYKKGEAIVDEDGFTLVTRGGVYGTTVGGGVGVASRKFQMDAAAGKGDVTQQGKKKKKKEKEDFYTFQVREQKRKGKIDHKPPCSPHLTSLVVRLYGLTS